MRLSDLNLPKLNEQLTKDSLTTEDFINILKSSVNFEDEGIELEEEIKDSDVTYEPKEEYQNTEYDVKLEYIGVKYMSPGILLMSDFEDFMSTLAIKYVYSQINDILEPYFDETAFYNDILSNKSLRTLLLEEADIYNFEEVEYQGVRYALVQIV